MRERRVEIIEAGAVVVVRRGRGGVGWEGWGGRGGGEKDGDG